MRGRYRILLGMAAGVGKTYRMLQEGRQAQTEGRDVVIGYLEPHDRPETAALAEGLEVVSRYRAAHGNLELEEMDADAVIRRAPELALIDELAHTNAPGMRNEKRYQDIDEVLAAGIDVVSTVNIQHLESLNDAIAELTDVKVRETFPDRILEEADEVVLVDLTPAGAPGAAAGGQGLPARAGGGRAPELLQASSGCPRCASWRCARSPRTSRRGGRRSCSTRGASRRWRSACSCSSRPSRARSGSCGGPGARPSGSARSSTRCGCAIRRSSSRRRSRCRSPHCAASPSCSARTSSRRRATSSSPPCAASSTSAASTYVFVGTPDESRAPRDPARLARLRARPRAAGGRHPRRRQPRRPAGGGAVSPLDVVLLAVAIGARGRARRRADPAAAAEAPPGAGGRPPHSRAVRRPARRDRAVRRDPDRPGGGGGARARVPADRAAAVRRGLAGEGRGEDRDAAARGGRARRAAGRRRRRRADREGADADPRAAAAVGGRAVRPHRRARPGQRRRRLHGEGARVAPRATRRRRRSSSSRRRPGRRGSARPAARPSAPARPAGALPLAR